MILVIIHLLHVDLLAPDFLSEAVLKAGEKPG